MTNSEWLKLLYEKHEAHICIVLSIITVILIVVAVLVDPLITIVAVVIGSLPLSIGITKFLEWLDKEHDDVNRS